MSSKEIPPKEAQQNRLHILYLCCKTATALILTLVLLVPAIFLVGTEDSYYYEKPIYSLFEQSDYLQGIKNDLDSKIADAKPFDAINLYSTNSTDGKISPYIQKEEARRWQNLKETTEFLGFLLNQRGEATVSRFIKHPSENISSPTNKQNIKSLTKNAYNFDRPSNLILYLKKKLTKMLTNIITRLNWKTEDKPDAISKLKNQIIALVEQERGNKIWIVLLSQQNQEFQNRQILFKKIAEWKQNHKNDKLIIVSRLPIDPVNQKIAAISVDITKQKLLSEIENLSQLKANLKFPFEIDRPNKVFAYLVNKYQGSLSKLSKFVQSCHENPQCKFTFNNLRQWALSKQPGGDNRGAKEQFCQLEEHYFSNLNDKQLKNKYEFLILTSSRADKKQFKSELSIYHNIIKADLCEERPAEIKPEAGVEISSQKQSDTSAVESSQQSQIKVPTKKNTKKEGGKDDQNKKAKEKLKKLKEEVEQEAEQKAKLQNIKKQKAKKKSNLQEKIEKANKKLEEKRQQKIKKEKAPSAQPEQTEPTQQENIKQITPSSETKIEDKVQQMPTDPAAPQLEAEKENQSEQEEVIPNKNQFQVLSTDPQENLPCEQEHSCPKQVQEAPNTAVQQQQGQGCDKQSKQTCEDSQKQAEIAESKEKEQEDNKENIQIESQ